jgi:hypothetical protein
VLLAGSPACQQPAFCYTRHKKTDTYNRNTWGGFMVNENLYKAACLGLQVLDEYIESPNVPVIMEDAQMAKRDLENAIWDYEQAQAQKDEGAWFWLLWYAVMVAGMIVGLLDLFVWRP